MTSMVVSPPDQQQGEPESERMEGITAMIHFGEVAREQAVIYAGGVSKGGTLVAVTTLFGTARVVTKTMDDCGPIDSGYVDPVKQRRALDMAAPFSSLLWLPVLSNDPVPFSKLMNMPIGSGSATPFSSWLRWPTLGGSGALFSRYFGAKVLSDDQSPFSSLLKWPTLGGSGGLFSSWLKWPTLAGSVSPFSDWLKIPTPSNNPAPFSSLFKWPVLSQKKD